jgi:hypothetical protein
MKIGGMTVSVKKEDIYRLIDRMDPSDHEFVYELLQRLIHADDKMVSDNSPLTEEEMKDIEEARARVNNGEYVKWEDIKRENQL